MPKTSSRNKGGSRIVRATLALALCATAGGLVALRAREPKPSAAGALTADRAIAKVTSFEVTTVANGELEAKDKIEVRNPLDQESTIVQIMAEGSWAKKGEVLVQLNADTIQQKVDEESLRFKSGDAQRIAAESAYQIQEIDNASKVRQAELKVELAELALRQWAEGDIKKKRQELDLMIDKSVLEVERIAKKYLRSQELLEEEFISKDECDRDEVAYIEAIAAYRTATVSRQVFEVYEYEKERKSKQSDVDEARAELERVKINNVIELANKDAQRSNQRSQVSIIENRLNKLKADHANTSILAPSDGLVVYASSMERSMWGGRGEGPLQIGQQVYPNQLLMILPDTSMMVAAVKVSESLAGKIRAGQSVSVRVDAAAGAVFNGSVESIGVMAETGGWRDPNLREYTVRVALQTDRKDLKPAMRCEGRIILDQVTDALTVPVQAVFSDGPVQFVYSPKGSKFARTPVRVGRRSDLLAEVKAGISEGDTVLVREPAPGEVLSEPWKNETLAAIGYAISPEGQVLPDATEASAPPGAPPPMSGSGTPSRGGGGGGGRPRGGGGGGGGSRGR
ncbi:MAG: HlyD family efflux transporter periplasmic adaptor subunit [Phycisphaerales bacterium]|nr:HlyD family efflux transporter periplasmic adaptor subunit [Phycisphaerales bacterium]